MPIHFQQASIMLLKQLGYSAFFAAIFAASDYVGNNDRLVLSHLIGVIILAISLAVINTLEAFYQAKGDVAAATGLAQLEPRLQFLEQRIFALPTLLQGIAQAPTLPPQPPFSMSPGQPAPAPLPNQAGPAPLVAPPQPPQAAKSAQPLAPKFTAPSVTGGPLFAAPPGGNQPDGTFTLAGPDMEARLSSFPFQQGQEQK